VALALRRHGVTRVRPLAGGYAGWRRRGFPVQRIAPDTSAA
jgi:rhodanese-related sulfurtransferase